VFLGILGTVYHFAVQSIDEEMSSNHFENGEFADLRSLAEVLDFTEISIAAQGKAQLDWHKRNGFCGVCGGITMMKRGGHVRECSNCFSLNYARTDSVVIMIVYSGDWCLLGQTRGRSTDKSRYSILAGFVEQGESIEEAVAREVMEEAGVYVKNIKYHSSQPWPFPSNLMIGCHAEAVSTKVKVDNEEMQDVRWFHRDEVIKSLDGVNSALTLPGPIAIAHHLIKSWVEHKFG
jgi:NAD+ diphosphatase